MATCNNNVVGCVHNQLKGSDLVVEVECINRREKKVCSARLDFLTHTLAQFEQWYKGKGLDWDSYVAKVVKGHFGSDEMHVTVDEIRDANNQPSQALAYECAENETWERRLAYKAEKAQYSNEEQLSYALRSLEYAEAELALCGKIQDFLDVVVEKQDKVLARKAKNRVQVLFQEKKLSFDSFMIMANQCHEVLGWREIKSNRPTRSVLDRISFWQDKVEACHAKAVEDEGRVFETSLETLDNDTLSLSVGIDF